MPAKSSVDADAARPLMLSAHDAAVSRHAGNAGGNLVRRAGTGTPRGRLRRRRPEPDIHGHPRLHGHSGVVPSNPDIHRHANIHRHSDGTTNSGAVNRHACLHAYRDFDSNDPLANTHSTADPDH